MEKLNELVEQANFVADWHGSDWSSALCQDKDGKQAHEIICESRGESVISTGSNSNEASWLCDYLELCSPENILAITEAFRAMEKEARKNLEGAAAWQNRSEAAEAKLAELGSEFDDLARAIGWSRECCEQTGESPMDVAVSLVNLVSELENDAFTTTDEWAIDKTCGRPILVYKGCSVIEAGDAAYILKLVKEDKLRAGEPS